MLRKKKAASTVKKKLAAAIVWAADAVRELLGSIRRRAGKARDDLAAMVGKNLSACCLDSMKKGGGAYLGLAPFSLAKYVSPLNRHAIRLGSVRALLKGENPALANRALNQSTPPEKREKFSNADHTKCHSPSPH